MRDSDWSRENLLRSDWSVPKGAIMTTNTQAGLAEAKKLFDDPSSGIYLFNFVHLYIEFYLEFDKS